MFEGGIDTHVGECSTLHNAHRTTRWNLCTRGEDVPGFHAMLGGRICRHLGSSCLIACLCSLVHPEQWVLCKFSSLHLC